MLSLRPRRVRPNWPMATPTRDPVVRYLLLHATMLRRTGRRAAAERVDEHARALEFLADYVRTLAEDDERLLQLATTHSANSWVPQSTSARRSSASSAASRATMLWPERESSVFCRPARAKP